MNAISNATEAAVHYVVDLANLHGHLYEITATFATARLLQGGAGPLDFRLPVWTPGSYLIREYPRHVQDMRAFDAEGHALAVHKVDKATWRVAPHGGSHVVLKYRVYAFDLTVRAAHLDDTHGYWNGACLCLYHEALRAEPHHVTVIAPKHWHVTTALPKSGDVFSAASYDEIVDSPFEVGTHEVQEFRAGDKPHRLAIWGDVPKARTELVADITKIVEAGAALFSGLPYPDYTFILLSAPNSYGGLEHARSTTLLTSPFSFSPREKYEEFLELVSHEFFHLWNVKRIHPEALGPFDYQREAYTRSLWVMEGFTSYYDRYLLVRAGLLSPERFLKKLGEELVRIRNIAGRKHHSLEDASFDAWIKFYRPDENSNNSSISYYLKGGVVVLMLDLDIRIRTEGRKTLDDVLHLLWERYGQRGVGFPDDKMQSIVEEATGLSLDAFFERYVRGREELDVESLLRPFGLELKAADDDSDKNKGWLGATFKSGAGGVTVTEATAEGPAAVGGIYAGDELVALDGYRIDLASAKERIAAKAPGEPVTFSLFRRDRLKNITVVLGVRPTDKLAVALRKDATDGEKTAQTAWLGRLISSSDE